MNQSLAPKVTLRDMQNTDDIEELVDAFYGRALTDPVIGFYFTEVADFNLETHLPTMYRFWSGILLGLPTYRSNAFQPHALLNEKHAFQPKHFARWLRLFFETIDELFEGPMTDLAKKRAQQIATSMSAKLENINSEA